MAKQTQITSRKAETMTFGIELETLMPNAMRHTIAVGGYHRGIEIPQGQAGFPGSGWKVENDSSIGTTLRTHTAVEFVSPVMKGRAGLEEVQAVGVWMEANGFRTNKSCGTHVHVGYASAAGSDDIEVIAHWAANLVNLVAQNESAIRGAAGSWGRINGSWCRTVRTDGHRADANRARRASGSRKLDALFASYQGTTERYRVLNLTRLQRRMHTVEFRAFTGTTCPVKMVGWVQLCLALCERAAGQGVRFDAPRTTCYRGNGDALKVMNRFFYLMGWTLGRKDKNAVEVQASGFAMDLSNMKAIKKELKRLAKKFDTEAPAVAA